MVCPGGNGTSECNGFGLCWTLNKLARYALSPLREKLNITYSRPWDAFKIRICNCGRSVAQSIVRLLCPVS